MINLLNQLIPTVITLGVLIFIHELGHFLACRFAGVGVEKFSIGFGPELVSWQGKETRYSISVIPFGGFVKPCGETHEEIEKRGSPDPRDFLSASRWNRFVILFAGVAMNFLFAYILFATVLFVGRPVLSATIGGFVDGLPAGASGLRIGDKVVRLNDTSIGNWQDLTIAILTSKGSVLNFTVARGAGTFNVQVTPKFGAGRDIFGKETHVPQVGIRPGEQFMIEKYGLGEALVKGAEIELELTTLTYQALWRLVTGQLSLKTISGPIGIISMAGNAAKLGVVALLQFTAILSVSLAVINLLPIPALDGGHLLFLVIESIRRKRISLAFQERVTQIGFYFLMALMVLVVFNDLVNIGAIEKLKLLFSHSG